MPRRTVAMRRPYSSAPTPPAAAPQALPIPTAPITSMPCRAAASTRPTMKPRWMSLELLVVLKVCGQQGKSVL